jgi:phosphoglycerate kinase
MAAIDLDRIKTLDDVELSGKRALVRVDINVPIRDGVVGDRTRITAVVPTVRAIVDAGGRAILVAHLGRPTGQVVPELSLEVLKGPLAEELGVPVAFAKDMAEAATLADDVVLLENIRFLAGEEKNDPETAKALAELGDVFVNDAFSAAHRAHASTAGVAALLPAIAGRQMDAELKALALALNAPARPTMAVVGGAKVSTKIDVLNNLVKQVDKLIVGGGMANTFLLARGQDIGKSLAEPDLAETANEILATAKENGCEILLPVDVTVAKAFEAGADNRVCALHEVAEDEMILDVGPVTVDLFNTHLDETRTVLWNGPLGAFEIDPFGDGTFALAQRAAELTRAGKLVSVAGGGDTVAALNAAGVGDAFSYVSTAGGAFLEYLEGRELPGVAALMAEA